MSDKNQNESAFVEASVADIPSQPMSQEHKTVVTNHKTVYQENNDRSPSKVILGDDFEIVDIPNYFGDKKLVVGLKFGMAKQEFIDAIPVLEDVNTITGGQSKQKTTAKGIKVKKL